MADQSQDKHQGHDDDRGYDERGEYRDGKGDRQGQHGEQFGNDYGFGREGELVEPLGYGYGKQQESDYVDRYGMPDQAEVFLDEGPKTGCGPRNCGEPRGGIFDDVCVRLTQHGQLDASGIEVEIQETVVVLSGKVPSLQEIRLAEEVTRSIQGVTGVENRLEVV